MSTVAPSFEQYVAARQAALLRTAYLLVGHHQDAEDLVQGVLVKAVAVWGRIEENPEPYLRKALYHDAVSRWRRRSRRGEYVTDRVPERAAPDGDDATRLTLAEALLRLTPKQRAVLVLRYYEDLTEVQAAEILGVGVGTVKSQTRHALGRLRAVAPELGDLIGVGI